MKKIFLLFFCAIPQFCFASNNITKLTSSEIIFLIVVAIFAYVILLIKRETSKNIYNQNIDMIISSPTPQNTQLKRIAIYTGLNKIKSNDNNFSIISFIDFASLLFVKYHQNYGYKAIKNIQPFFDFELNNNSDTIETDIRIENIIIYDVRCENESNYIIIEFVSTYTSIIGLQNKATTHREKSVERWLFHRNQKYKSPSQPEEIGVLSGFCNDWKVSSINIVSVVRVNKYQSERMFVYNGIKNKSEHIDNMELMFQNYHRGEYFGYTDFCKKTAIPYFKAIWEDYANDGFEKCKYTLSHNILDYIRVHKKLINSGNNVSKIENIDVTDYEVIKYVADNFYELITIKIYFSCLDYVLNSDKKCISGNSILPEETSVFVSFVAHHRTLTEKDSKYIIYSIWN
ncbi:MAG: hypothetical protein MJ211_07220 [Bacteroidales bacterium]|nr:hypothetical protein [Bacteroidales bacterium]